MRFSEWLRVGFGFRSEAERRVVALFRATHPDQHVAWTSLVADEDDRCVVGVYYGTTRPPCFLFFSVDRRSGAITALEDAKAYAPKVWR